MRLTLAFATFAALLAFAAPAAAQDKAADIVRAALEQNSTGLQVGVGTLTLTTEDSSGARKLRHLAFKGANTPEGRRTLVRLLSPEEVKGQSFLFREVRQGDDQVYWYLPAFGATRRISGGQKRGSFMGTHFTFADLESRDIQDAAYRSLPDAKVGELPCYVIEATPRGESDYARIVLSIRRDDRMLLKARFYDKAGAELKTLFIEKVDTAGERRYVKQMVLRPQAGGYTRITIDTLDPGRAPTEAELTPEALINE